MYMIYFAWMIIDTQIQGQIPHPDIIHLATPATVPRNPHDIYFQ